MAQKYWLQHMSHSAGQPRHSGVPAANPSMARWQEQMHLLHSTLLRELKSPAFSTAQIELAAQKVLQGARDAVASIRLEAKQGVSVSFSFHPLDTEYHEYIATVLLAVPARKGAAWGEQGHVSEAALQTILEAYSNVAAVGVGTHGQLGNVKGLLRGLVKAVDLGGEELEARALFLLSQVALAGPEMAAGIALLPGLTAACLNAIATRTKSEKPMLNRCLPADIPMLCASPRLCLLKVRGRERLEWSRGCTMNDVEPAWHLTLAIISRASLQLLRGAAMPSCSSTTLPRWGAKMPWAHSLPTALSCAN